MTNSTKKTVRVVFPSWQGGQNSPYYLGSQLLHFLAPPVADSEEHKTIVIPVPKPPKTIGYYPQSEYTAKAVVKDDIADKDDLLKAHRYAWNKLKEENPDRISVLGGDCLVEAAPFAFLIDKYTKQDPKRNRVGVLWFDAHPDILTPKDFCRAHTHILSLLLHRQGSDEDFKRLVPTPVTSSQVMYVGLQEMDKRESDYVYSPNERFHFTTVEQVKQNRTANVASDNIKKWIQKEGITHLVVHLDMDVFDYQKLRCLLFANPNEDASFYDGISKGRLLIPEVVKILSDVSAYARETHQPGSKDKKFSIVCMGITELFPWDEINVQEMLHNLPVINSKL